MNAAAPTRDHASSDASPVAALSALVGAVFAFGTGAYVFSGLLEPMATDLGVSVGAAAQLQTAFTLSCALGGPALAGVTAALARKRLLLTVVLLLGIGNVAAALSDSFEALVLFRTMTGFAGALTLPAASAIIVTLVPPERRASAFALVLGGNSLAFLFGVPIGSVIGDYFGWSATFWFAAALCIAALWAVWRAVPNAPAPDRSLAPESLQKGLAQSLAPLLGITLLCFTATFATSGLTGPVVTALTGFTGSLIGIMQTLIGVGAIAGLVLGAHLAKGARRPLPWLGAGTLAAQLLYACGLIWPPGGATGVAVCAIAILGGSTCLFAVLPIVQARIAVLAGANATVAFALNGSMVYLGQAFGTAIGGIASREFDLYAAPVAGSVVALIALSVGFAYRDRAGRTDEYAAPTDG